MTVLNVLSPFALSLQALAVPVGMKGNSKDGSNQDRYRVRWRKWLSAENCALKSDLRTDRIVQSEWP